MTHGYLLPKKQRNIANSSYKPTKHQLNFYRNSSKIATLLILSGKTDTMNFEIDEKTFFEEMGNISYGTAELKIQDMKQYSNEILREQSITAAVSNWEYYFSDIFEQILNNNNFIKLIYKNKEKLKTFLNKFKLMQDFQAEFFLNENKIDGLKFGTYIKKIKRINFQEPDDLKYIIKILFDINIVKIDETHWTEIVTFIKDRHAIVHKPSNLDDTQSIIQKYPKDKIENILKHMSNIIKKVDEDLFTNYSTMPPMYNTVVI